MHAEKLDHIGIKVGSIEQALPEYTSMGFRISARSRFPEVGVEVAFLELGGQKFELLEPFGQDSSIGEDPDGLHHMAFFCGNIHAAYDEMQGDPRYCVMGPPIVGAHGRPVLFFRMKGSKALLELVGAMRALTDEPEIWRW